MDVPDSMFMLAAGSDIDEDELQQVVKKIKRKMKEAHNLRERKKSKIETTDEQLSDEAQESASSPLSASSASSSSGQQQQKMEVKQDIRQSSKKKRKKASSAAGSESQEIVDINETSPSTSRVIPLTENQEVADMTYSSPSTSRVTSPAEENSQSGNTGKSRKEKRKLDKRLKRLLSRKTDNVLNRKRPKLESVGLVKEDVSEENRCKLCLCSLSKCSKSGCVKPGDKSSDTGNSGVQGDSNSDSGVETLPSCKLSTQGQSPVCDMGSGCTWSEGKPDKTSQIDVQTNNKEIPAEDMFLALDCEFVGVGPKGSKSRLGRVSIVDFWGNIVYDVYSRPAEPITDYRTRWSGIRPKHMKFSCPFNIVQTRVKNILKDKYVIGHAVFNDFRVLGFKHPGHHIRDTASYKPLREMANFASNTCCSLKKLSSALLNKQIQTQEHNSVEDALATLDLYKLVRTEWEQKILEKGSKRGGGSEIQGRRRSEEGADSEEQTEVEQSFLDDQFWLMDMFSDQKPADNADNTI